MDKIPAKLHRAGTRRSHAHRKGGVGKALTLIRGRRVVVLRVEAGLLPAYRGHAVTHWFGMLNALREKLRHPFTPVYYLGTLVHPSSYRFFCKYFPRVFPRRGDDLRAGLGPVALEIANSFSNPPVDPGQPFVRDVGWVTIEEQAGIGQDSVRENPDASYFQTVNPGYIHGHGLVVLVPVTIANISTAIATRIREATLGALRRTHIPV